MLLFPHLAKAGCTTIVATVQQSTTTSGSTVSYVSMNVKEETNWHYGNVLKLGMWWQLHSFKWLKKNHLIAINDEWMLWYVKYVPPPIKLLKKWQTGEIAQWLRALEVFRGPEFNSQHLYQAANNHQRIWYLCSPAYAYLHSTHKWKLKKKNSFKKISAKD